MQSEVTIRQGWLAAQGFGQALRKDSSVLLAMPTDRLLCLDMGSFYNGTMVQDGSQWIPQIRQWARELGFSQIGVSDVDLSGAEPGLMQWLAQGFHGEMHYMQTHGLKRARPAELVPGTISVVTARMDYLPREFALFGAHAERALPPSDTAGLVSTKEWQMAELARLQQPQEAIVSLYARGRDYHKVLRARLQRLSERMAQIMGPLGYRVFTDSAPVLEAELAQRSGQGWRGKHTLVLSRQAGSMFFLGEIYLDKPLPPTPAVTAHCGRCQSCIDVCPTGAIVAPYRLDARRCISYLTIEHPGPIPEDVRSLMGNRIYGCDDCQLVCPWNKFAQPSTLADFDARPALYGRSIVELFAWDEATFLRTTEGGPIRRIGYERWLRNLAVALGNALRQAAPHEAHTLRAALQARAGHDSVLVREHVIWALQQS